MIWFTADTHFNHGKILETAKRPFGSMDEMNETIIENWNRDVKRGDVIYHLGDFAWKGTEHFLRVLNGSIILIEGNHDADAHKYRKKFAGYFRLKDIHYKDNYIVLCHYAMRVWNRSHWNSWQLYGHSHGRLNPEGKQWDVSVDNTGFKLLSIEQIEAIMKTRPDNFNLVKER